MKEEPRFLSFFLSFCLHAGVIVLILAHSYLTPPKPMLPVDAIRITIGDDIVTARGDGVEGDGGTGAKENYGTPGPGDPQGIPYGRGLGQRPVEVAKTPPAPDAGQDKPALGTPIQKPEDSPPQAPQTPQAPATETLTAQAPSTEEIAPPETGPAPEATAPETATPETGPTKETPADGGEIPVPEEPTKKEPDAAAKKPAETKTAEKKGNSSKPPANSKKGNSLDAALKDLGKQADSGKKAQGDAIGDALKDLRSSGATAGTTGGTGSQAQAGSTTGSAGGSTAGGTGSGGAPALGVPGGAGQPGTPFGRVGRPGTGGIGGGSSVGRLGAYSEHIVSRVRPHFTWPQRADRKYLQAIVRLHIADDGTLVNIDVLESSGEPGFDAAVQNALIRAGRFESPPDDQDRIKDVTFTSDMAS